MTDSIYMIAETWDALRSHIDVNERKDAAYTLINFLIDNDFEPDDIKDAFRGEKVVLLALNDYLENHDTEEEYEEDEYSDDDSDDDW